MEKQIHESFNATNYKDNIRIGLNRRNVIISVIIITLGSVSVYYLNNSSIESSSPYYMLYALTNFMIILVGCIKLVFFSKQHKYIATNSPIKKYTLFFKKEELERVIYAIESNDMELLKKIEKKDETGVRVDVQLSKDGMFCLCQVFDYVPYKYQAISPVYQLNETASKQIGTLFGIQPAKYVSKYTLRTTQR